MDVGHRAGDGFSDNTGGFGPEFRRAGRIEPPCETALPLMGIGSLYLSDEGTGEVHAT